MQREKWYVFGQFIGVFHDQIMGKRITDRLSLPLISADSENFCTFGQHRHGGGAGALLTG